ncbi:penicillin-binding protein activator [Marinobacterium mangrovicola]|uniref:LppC lipoprotein n=1 Tax=Marinobacterium mangrovicola TaxID=1476959 RepID=A0A4R1GFL7_9GAMM|nr:penicillin-binding protein activator [Marinobacterium mangrovicola]TCK03012.1 hypothetical protein CLV83_4068 [Marinobacterium mangrovicola]
MTNKTRLPLCILLISLLSACAGPISTSRTSSQGGEIEQILARADSAPPIEAAQLRLQAAQSLMRQGETKRALSLLEGIDTKNLPPSLAFDIARLRADEALRDNDSDRALRVLDTRALPSLSQPQQSTLGSMRAEAFSLQNQPIDAARELIAIAQLQQTSEQTQATHDQIWSLLKQTPISTLRQAATDPHNDFYEQGWFELALAATQTGDITQGSSAMTEWQTLWQNHPAYTLPPQGLQSKRVEIMDVSRIGLLLPLSGQLAEPARAISEGFYSAMMTSNSGMAQPEIISIDSTRVSTPAQLASLAQQQQLDLIIGPLSQDYVAQLGSINNFPVPVLALNRGPQNSSLYQLDLSSEQEAQLVAQKAWQDGHRRAALIIPAAEWGQHLASSFEQAFNALGGQVTARLDYTGSNELSSQISQLLLTNQSQARAQQVRRTIGQSVDFNETPRSDIDAIVMTALPQDARQIKPMLAFHFAGDIPVYATSHIYEGTPDSTRDVDLNGINFLDLPWVLEPASEAHRALQQTRNDTENRFGRLYALGIDAYKLYPYLTGLSQNPSAFVEGETGLLRLDNQGRVKRTLPWARFNDGVPVLQTPSLPEQPQQTIPTSE